MERSVPLQHPDHGDGSGDNEGVTLLKPMFFAVQALEAVELVGEEHGILSKIWRGNRQGQQADAVTKAVRGLKEGGQGSVCSSEWSIQDGFLCFQGKIYIPNDPELHCHIMAQHHNSKIAGHPGCWKTLELVTQNYWWLQMSHYIGQYCKTCNMCSCTKIQHQ